MAKATCTVEGCPKPSHTRGLCDKHRYEADPEYFKAKARRRWQEKHDACMARKRQYRLENLALINERDRQWRATNRDAVNAAGRQYYWANRERLLANQKAYYQAHKEAWLVWQRAYRRARPEVGAETLRRRRARKKSTVIGRITPELLTAKFAYWGNRCWLCGASERLEADHVKPLAKGGTHCLANIRPICRWCNPSKSDQWPYPVTGSPVWAFPSPG